MAIKHYLEKVNPQGRGVAAKVVEAVEYGGASYLFGYLSNRYRERASVFGVPVDLVAGVGFKALALAGDLLGKGRGLTPHANVFGNAGIGAYFHTLGAGHGAAASGVKRLIIPAGDLQKAKAALPNATVLGDLGRAPHGQALSSQQLADLAR